MGTDREAMRKALQNLADAFHQGRATHAQPESSGYVQSLVDAAEEALAAPEGDDAKRLDWLDSAGCNSVFKLGPRWYTRANYSAPIHRADNLRAAIDSAMSGGKETTHAD